MMQSKKAVGGHSPHLHPLLSPMLIFENRSRMVGCNGKMHIWINTHTHTLNCRGLYGKTPWQYIWNYVIINHVHAIVTIHLFFSFMLSFLSSFTQRVSPCCRTFLKQFRFFIFFHSKVQSEPTQTLTELHCS